MKNFFLWLLIVTLFVSLTGCKDKQQPDGTTNTNASQNIATENKKTENTQNTATEATENDATLNTESQQNPATEATGSESEEENPYAIREVTDDRVITAEHKKAYGDGFFTLTFPLDWKCLEQQHEDGRCVYIQDSALGDKCEISISVTGAIYASDMKPEEYLKYLPSSYENVVIDTVTEETIQDFKCTKVVYSYTKDNTQYICIQYDKLIEDVRLFNIRIRYPAANKETYKTIFNAIMDSFRLNGMGLKKISDLPLQEAYAYAVKQYEENPQRHRDICELQRETKQIVKIDGKYYQSYVASNVDHRYIWISRSEFPEESYANTATWDWYIVGTANVYSMDLLGKIDKGRK